MQHMHHIFDRAHVDFVSTQMCALFPSDTRLVTIYSYGHEELPV